MLGGRGRGGANGDGDCRASIPAAAAQACDRALTRCLHLPSIAHLAAMHHAHTFPRNRVSPVPCPPPPPCHAVLQCERLGQTIIFVRTRETARRLHEAVSGREALAQPMPMR